MYGACLLACFSGASVLPPLPRWTRQARQTRLAFPSASMPATFSGLPNQVQPSHLSSRHSLLTGGWDMTASPSGPLGSSCRLLTSAAVPVSPALAPGPFCAARAWGRQARPPSPPSPKAPHPSTRMTTGIEHGGDGDLRTTWSSISRSGCSSMRSGDTRAHWTRDTQRTIV